MTPDGLLVADSDMHVFEPADLWERWIAPEWRHAESVAAFRTLPLSATSQRKILWDNWSRLYDVPAPAGC